MNVLYSHDEYKELTVAHALDALGTAEAREVETHLGACEDCRAEFDSWRETASSLAFAAETAMPSPEVRTRVLEQARALSETSIERRGERNAVSNEYPSNTANVIPLRKPVRRGWSGAEMFRAIAASLVIVILLGAVVVLWQRNRGMEKELARLSQRANESDQELARLREEKGLMVAPGARVASLYGTEIAREANAMLLFNRETGRAMLVANGLPPAPAGQAYQLWFIPKGKQPIPGGVFAADEKGHAELRDMVPPEGRDALVFAVTLERAGGVPAPQGKMYLKGSAS